jgi:hypothetical protein
MECARHVAAQVGATEGCHWRAHHVACDLSKKQRWPFILLQMWCAYSAGALSVFYDGHLYELRILNMLPLKTPHSVWGPSGPPLLEDYLKAVEAEKGDTFLLDGVLPTDSVILMSGRAKLAHKTWDAMLMCQALVTGLPSSMYVPVNKDGVNVLFCEHEGSRRLTARRWRAIQAAYPAKEKGKIFFAHRYPIVLNDVAWQKRLADFVRDNQIALVVIDTLTKAMRGDENDSANVSDVMRALDFVANAGQQTSIMFLHHLRKTSGERSFDVDIDDEIRGSSAIAGNYGVHYALRTPDWDNSILWKTIRDSQGEESIYRMVWDISGAPLHATLTTQLLAKGAPDKALIVTCLNKLLPGKIYKSNQILELWELPSMLASKIRRELEKGEIEQTPRGWRRT